MFSFERARHVLSHWACIHRVLGHILLWCCVYMTGHTCAVGMWRSEHNLLQSAFSSMSTPDLGIELQFRLVWWVVSPQSHLCSLQPSLYLCLFPDSVMLRFLGRSWFCNPSASSFGCWDYRYHQTRLYSAFLFHFFKRKETYFLVGKKRQKKLCESLMITQWVLFSCVYVISFSIYYLLEK